MPSSNPPRRRRQSSSRPAPLRRKSAPSHDAPRHVLVVDDDEIDREAVIRALRGRPLLILTAANAAEALAKLETEHVDVMLLDHHLPDAVAPDVLDELADRGIDVPVILLTGSRDPDVVAEAMRRGAVDYVPKGASLEERLHQVIAVALRVADVERELARAHDESQRQAARLLRKAEATIEVQSATDPEDAIRRAAVGFHRMLEVSAEVRLMSKDPPLFARAGDPMPPEHTEIVLELPRVGLTGEVKLGKLIDDEHERLSATLLGRSVSQSLESLILLARAEEAARARRDIAAIVSHDLRSPLQAFALGVKLLEHRPDDPTYGDILGRMRRNVGSMERLIRDILDATRLDDDAFSLTLTEMDVRTVLRDVLDEHAPLADSESIELVSDMRGSDGDDTALVGDSTRVRQAVGNLIANAIKHTPKGGRVTARAVFEDDAVRFEIEDTGPGVPPEVRDRIFERLVRGPNGHALGLGLGLYIARGIAHAHGGSVGLVREERAGSCFWLSFPRGASSTSSARRD